MPHRHGPKVGRSEWQEAIQHLTGQMDNIVTRLIQLELKMHEMEHSCNNTVVTEHREGTEKNVTDRLNRLECIYVSVDFLTLEKAADKILECAQGTSFDKLYNEATSMEKHTTGRTYDKETPPAEREVGCTAEPLGPNKQSVFEDVFDCLQGMVKECRSMEQVSKPIVRKLWLKAMRNIVGKVVRSFFRSMVINRRANQSYNTNWLSSRALPSVLLLHVTRGTLESILVKLARLFC